MNSANHFIKKFGKFWSRRERYLVIALALVSVIFLAVLIAALVTWTKPRETSTQNSTAVPGIANLCTTDDCIEAAAMIVSSRDASTPACQDFYQHACGLWPSVNHIPDDESHWTADNLANDRLIWDMKSILEEGSAHLNLASTDPIDNVYISYNACMNQDTVDSLSMVPLVKLLGDKSKWPLLSRIPSADSKTQIKDTIVSFLPYGVDFFFSVTVDADEKNSSVNIVIVDQPSFGLPQSYLVGNGSAAEIAAYKQLIKDTALLLNSTNTNLDSDIDDMVALEMKLANMSSPPELNRLVNRTYNKMNVSQLQDITAGGNNSVNQTLDWLAFLHVINSGINESTEVIVREVDYITNMAAYIGSDDVSYGVLQNYVVWRLIQPTLWNLNAAMRDSVFKFQEVLNGVSNTSPRWKSCVEYTNTNLGFALSAPYVQRHFSNETRQAVMAMVLELIGAFKEMLDKNVWLNKTLIPEVKNKADKIRIHVGYPDWILVKKELGNYYENVSFPLNPSTHYANLLALMKGATLRQFQRLTEPTNPELWFFSPTIVNAAYSDERNSIEFPAGILQPPFYFANGPKSINFGSIGAVIGHEITHGFDDQGSLFTWQGDYAPWWDSATTARFQHQRQCYIDQYSKFCPPELNKNNETKEICVNGNNTVGENIADNGGIKESFLAYKNHISNNGADVLLPGLNYTSEQLFFYAFAQSWCSNYRVEALLNQVENNEHSPPEYRVIGTMANSEDFSEAFQCPAPANPCVLW